MKLCPFNRQECIEECAIRYDHGCSILFISQSLERIAVELDRAAPEKWD